MGKTWTRADNDTEYKITSFAKELLTPICHYKNLMELEAVILGLTYKFYYLRGYGYVGAKTGGELISFATPQLLVDPESLD